MAERLFVRTFENFRGLDSNASPLSRESDFAIIADGVVLDEQKAIVAMPNYQRLALTQGQPSAGITIAPIGPLHGLVKHSYKNPITDQLTEDLLGIGNGLWRLATGSAVLTMTAGHTAIRSHNGITHRLYIYRDSDNALIYSSDESEGFAGAPLGSSLSAMKTAIDALGGSFGLSLTPFGKISGSSVAGEGSTISLQAGHTIGTAFTAAAAAGRALRLPIIALDSGGASQRMFYFDVIEMPTTNTMTIVNVRMVTNRSTGTSEGGMQLTNGDLVGIGMFSTMQLLESPSAATFTSGETQQVAYWEHVHTPTAMTNFLDRDVTPAINYRHNTVDRRLYPHSVSTANIYIALPKQAAYDRKQRQPFGVAKYDGDSLYLAGMPGASFTIGTPTTGAGMDDGRYKYLAQWKRVDRNGLTTYGNASLGIQGEAIVEVAGGAANNIVPLTINGIGTSSTVVDFGNNLSIKVHLTAGASALSAGAGLKTIAMASNSFRVGQMICYRDSITTELRYRLVHEVTATSITVKFDDLEPAENVGASTHVTNGISCEVYRTKANGQSYYLVSERLEDFNAATFTFNDNINNAALGIEWDGPHTGQERRDLPPPMTTMCDHQGTILGVKAESSQTRIAWASQFNPEYYPAATNELEMFPSVDGPVLATISANQDTLLLLRECNIYEVQGDVYSGVLFVAKTHYGIGGAAAQSAVTKMSDKVAMIGPLGICIYDNGQILDLGTRMRGSYASLSGFPLKFEWAVAATDTSQQKCYLYVPRFEAANRVYGASDNLLFSLDYSADGSLFLATEKQTQGASYNIGGGGITWQGEFVGLGLGRSGSLTVTQGALSRRPADNRGLQPNQFSQIFCQQWEFLKELSFIKDFMQVKVWSLTDWKATFGLKWFYDLESIAVDGTTTISLALTSSKRTQMALNPKRNATAIAIKFAGSSAKVWKAPDGSDEYLDALYNRMQLSKFKLSGYELVVNVPYNKERIDQGTP